MSDQLLLGEAGLVYLPDKREVVFTMQVGSQLSILDHPASGREPRGRKLWREPRA